MYTFPSYTHICSLQSWSSIVQPYSLFVNDATPFDTTFILSISCESSSIATSIILLHVCVGLVEKVLVAQAVLDHHNVAERAFDRVSPRRSVLPSVETNNAHDAVYVLYDALDHHGRRRRTRKVRSGNPGLRTQVPSSRQRWPCRCPPPCRGCRSSGIRAAS